MRTFGGGGGGNGFPGFWNLLAMTKELMTASEASENKTVRTIGDQFLLSGALGVSRFILYANVGFQFDPAGVVFRLYCAPNRAV